jgi:hypothetical protein
MNNEYKKYIDLKDAYRGKNFNGYPLDRVLGSYLANYSWMSKFNKCRFLVYCIINNHEISIDGDYLISYQTPRESYQNILENYILEYNIPTRSIQKIEMTKSFFLNIFSFLYYFIKYFKYNKSYSFFKNLIYNFFTAFSIRTISLLESKTLDCKQYTAFNSSYLYESFLTFYFRKRNIPTYSLQHGLYFNYLNEIPLDIINYENICAENLICWGNYTLDQIQSTVPKDVKLILGKYPYTIKFSKNRMKKNTVLVFLPRLIYISETKKLLNILENTGDNYLIRLHPNTTQSLQAYIAKIPSFEVDENPKLEITLAAYKYDFCIGFNTSSILEATLYGQEIVQYISKNDEFIIDNILSFNSLEKLKEIKKLQVFPKVNKYYYFAL